MNDDFYRVLEDKYRGSRGLIKSRLLVYLPFIEPLLGIYKDGKAIDLGCGRGEWLELLQESGFNVHGVDLDDGMLAACRERGLSVATQDAISALKALPDESQIIVSGFHIAEHLSFSDLQLLVKESLRVLKPAGLLILETPNPENITVGTVNFYLDPTHQKPIPPLLLSFLPEYYGFCKFKIIRLQEDEALAGSVRVSMSAVLGGVSPDYAVVAQKFADASVISRTSDAFAREYGLTLSALAERFDQQVQQASERAASAEAQAQRASVRAASAEAQAQQASERAASAEAQAQQASERAASAEAQAQQAAHGVQQEHAAERERLAQIAEAKAVASTAEQAAERWKQQANMWHERILALHASTSWRITKPIRFLKRLLTSDVVKFDQSTTAIKHKIKQNVRPMLSSCIAFVYRRPALRTRLKKLLMRFPRLYQRLRRNSYIPGLQSLNLLDSSAPAEGSRSRGTAPDVDAILERIRLALEKDSSK